MSNTSNMAAVKKSAADLYEALTIYDNLVFFFFYRDVISMIARTSKILQKLDLEIPEVGRCITMLCMWLRTYYAESEPFPTALAGDGYGDGLMAELFPKDFECMSSSTLVANSLVIETIEAELQKWKESVMKPDLIISGRPATHDVNNADKYKDLIGKKVQEEKAQEKAALVAALEASAQVPALSELILISISVHLNVAWASNPR